MFISRIAVLIGTDNATKLTTVDNASLFNPSLATNLSLALSVAIVIKEDIISCFLSPLTVFVNCSLNSLNVLYVTPFKTIKGPSSLSEISYSVKRLKFELGETTAPIAAPLFAENAFPFPRILFISILSSLERFLKYSDFELNSFHKASNIAKLAGVYDIAGLPS